MTKEDVANLIRFHYEQDDSSFIRQAKEIADEFYKEGNKELASYIYSMINNVSTIVPQGSRFSKLGSLEKIPYSKEPLYLPNDVENKLFGIINACKREIAPKKYLFFGAPGTGKTEAANQLARLLKRNLWKVNISDLIDSYLGETSKNIAALFENINNFPFKKTMVILIDEIDALSLKRNDNRDIREMDRATTELFKGIDSLSNDVVLVATTNLINDLDLALVRRFVAKVNFDTYTKEDLIQIGMRICNSTLEKTSDLLPDNKLLLKVLSTCESLPNPGELKNIIVSSISFSNFGTEYEYLKRIFCELHHCETIDLKKMYELNFSYRDIKKLTGISKSEVARRLSK